MKTPLTLPAPRRASLETPNGWATRPYTADDVLAVVRSGGWFHYPSTQFESDDVAAFAREAAGAWEEIWKDTL